ncbi:hypothetical protein ES705_36134 [subsurface metagenome]
MGAVNLNTSQYSNGWQNISATAIDKTGNIKSTSILVNIESRRIPGINLTILIISSILGIISNYTVE